MKNTDNNKGSISNLRADYEKNYAEIAAADLKESIQCVDFLEFQANALLQILHKYIPDFSNCEILEIGPGQGHLLKKILKGGDPSRISALDISHDYLSHLEPLGINTYKMDAEKIEFENKFDLVICTDVIEHVINPANLIFGINKCLKKDGILLLKAPYRENTMVYAHGLGCIWDFVHLRSYSKQCFKDIVRYGGFKILSYRTLFFQIPSMKFYVKSNKYTQYLYNILTKNIKQLSLAKTNKIPSWLLRLFLKPMEQVIVARKKDSLTRENLHTFW